MWKNNKTRQRKHQAFFKLIHYQGARRNTDIYYTLSPRSRKGQQVFRLSVVVRNFFMTWYGLHRKLAGRNKNNKDVKWFIPPQAVPCFKLLLVLLSRVPLFLVCKINASGIRRCFSFVTLPVTFQPTSEVWTKGTATAEQNDTNIKIVTKSYTRNLKRWMRRSQDRTRALRQRHPCRESRRYQTASSEEKDCVINKICAHTKFSLGKANKTE